MGKKLTQEEWVKRAEKIHAGRYDYSKVKYTNSKVKVEIVCKEHGSFWQEPSSHVHTGRGCPVCKGGVSIDTEEFVQRAKQVHGDAYNYDKVNYVNATIKVDIFCNTCKICFTQNPGHHLHGVGCKECGRRAATTKTSITFEEVKQKIINKFGDVYDFTAAVYTGRKKPLTVKCKLCGGVVSMAKAVDFYNGKRTTSCSCVATHLTSGFKDYLPATLYYLRVVDDQGIVSYKIGITNKTIQERYRKSDLQKITIVKTWDYIKGEKARFAEREILEKFKVYKPPLGYAPLTSGNTELFDRDVLELDGGEYGE